MRHMERYPAGYIRRSTASDSNPGDVSREVQERAIRDLAARDGHTDVRLFDDWGKSADEAKESKRVAFTAMLAAIERGEVAVVYGYALDRFYRSLRTYIRLTDAADAHAVPIITARDGRLGGDRSPDAIASSDMTAVFASRELRVIKARARAATDARVARHDKMGTPPYGKRIVRDAAGRAIKPIVWEDDPTRPLAPLLEAYRQAGTVMGACRLLNAAGVPTPYGKVDENGKPQGWQTTSLALILDRAGVLPTQGTRRHYSRTDVLAGILVCHCGRRMTPDASKGGYYCARAKIIEDHGRASVQQRALLPIIRAEADRLSIPFDDVELGQDDPGKRDSLAERKRRLALAFADGLFDESEYHQQVEAIGREVAHLDAAAEVVEIPPLDWSAPVPVINAALRALFEPIQLDAAMRIPITEGRPEIRWRVPEWRRV
jgi:DNA invertase Pin-like site-specific DNA recombinase